jgi:anaerobic selenocysteine-containing dehydrogenase
MMPGTHWRDTGDSVRVDTEIGYFVDSVWVTEGIKPGVVAVSHHLGRFRLEENSGVNRGRRIW